MSEQMHRYERPQIETLKATEVLERLGPVAAGSNLSAADTSSDDCSIADYLMGSNGC